MTEHSKSIHWMYYNRVILPLLWGGSRVLSQFHHKLHDGFQGRVGLIERAARARQAAGNKPVFLFHCASAGEMEALKPIAAELDRNHVFVAVSYFSPSALTALRNPAEFDYADYSPLDRWSEVNAYLDALRPSLVAITKHDIWPNFVWASAVRDIPVFLINGNFHGRSLRLWPGIRSFHAAAYAAFREIMVVSNDDAVNARRIVGNSVEVTVVGDARFDRVARRMAQRNPVPVTLEAMCTGRNVVIAGSTHEIDEELLIPAIPKLARSIPDFLLVIVPHDPSPKAKRRIQSLCRSHGVTVADIDATLTAEMPHALLVNRSGTLADMYRLGKAAYVGGGFGKGVHSVLEPMAAGLPVLCGPKIEVSAEARQGKSEGIVTVVAGRKQVEQSLTGFFADAARLRSLSDRTMAFVQTKTGAATAIANRLMETLRG